MKKTITLLVSLLALSAMLLAGCRPKEPEKALQGTPWTLESYGEAGNEQTVLEGTEITAAFEEGKVTGSAGCNRYFGGYEVNGSKLSFSPLGSTRMACPEPIMKQEQTFLSALQGAESYEIRGSTLTITSAGGNVLTFAASG